MRKKSGRKTKTVKDRKQRNKKDKGKTEDSE